MNVKKLFLMMAAVSGALALCQCSSEAVSYTHLAKSIRICVRSRAWTFS